MRSIAGLCLFIFLPLQVNSQNLLLRDSQTTLPLEAAVIFSESLNKFTTTDSRGRTDISSFRGAHDITVRLLGYKTHAFTWEELEEKQFMIFLETEEISLDEIVVSATRWQQKLRDIPSKITTIGRRDIILNNPQTAADLLGINGNVFIQKSQMGGGSPMIRGFATNRVLITVDGVRMNNAIFRSGNIQNVISIDPLVIENTEVLFGPGAIIYGSDALGGAMNFYTLDPKLNPYGKNIVTARTMGRFSSANLEKTAHASVTGGFKKWGFVTSLSLSDFGDLKTGKHGPDIFLRPEYVTRVNNRDTVVKNPDQRIQLHSGYGQANFLQKFKYSPASGLDLHYGFYYSNTTDVPRYDRLIEYNNQGNLRDGDWYYGPQKWLMNVVSAVSTRPSALHDQMRTVVAWQLFEESRHNRNFGSNNLNHRYEKVNAWSLNTDFDKMLDERKSLRYGAEFILNHVGSEAIRENIANGSLSPLSTRYPNGSEWYSAAAYVGLLNRVNREITLQTGLRYNLVGLEAEFDKTFYPFPFDAASLLQGALTGSAGIAFKPTNDWQLNLNLSTGFRAPNIDDVGKVFDSEPGNVIVPNPYLKPEYAWNLDAGIIRIINNKVKLDLAAFYTLLDNALVRREFLFNGQDSIIYDGNLSRVLSIQNAANARVYGLQAATEVKLGSEWTLVSRITWQSGEEELDDGSTAPLRHAVPLFGITRLTWTKKRLKTEIYAHYQGRITFENMPPSEIAKPHLYAADDNGNPYSPGWITLNLKTLYQANGYLQLCAGLENITNTLYRPYSSGISAPGTNLMLAVRASF